MTFTVTDRTSISGPKNDYGTASSWLQSLYRDRANKKIESQHIEEFHLFLQNPWHPEFPYSLNDLKLALTHSTFSHEWGKELFPSNERVEFIGDGVLNLLVAEKLYRLYPQYKEGQLSKLRGALVNEEALCELALMLQLDSSLFLGRGELKKVEAGQALPASILADLFEAVLGQIYLSFGVEETKTFLNKVFEIFKRTHAGYDFFDENRLQHFDPKSLLQEKLAKDSNKTPDYRSLEIHPGQFRVELWIGDELMLVKNGQSKKTIEKELAKEFLIKNFKNI